AGGEHHVALARRERPRFSFCEVGMGEGAEAGGIPSLGRVGAEKDGVGGHVSEVAYFVGIGGRFVPVINDVIHGGSFVLDVQGEKEYKQRSHAAHYLAR